MAFNTLFRSKGQQEVQELEKEGAKAISLQAEVGPLIEDENYVMVVGEERVVLQPHALEEESVKGLISVLLSWVNDTLEERRIVVRDIIEDIYDGQVLGELLAVLSKEEIRVIPVTQSSYMQKNKLKYLLEKVDKMLGLQENQRKKWSVKSIHSKDAVAILHLLVALARHFRCQHPLPRNVTVKRILLKQLDTKLDSQVILDEITGDDIGPTAPLYNKSTDRDVFDKLFEEAPEKLEAVKRSLCQFASRVLAEMEVIISDISTQFSSGVNFVMIMGLLEGYYVPQYLWHPNPKNFDEKNDNMKLAFQLMIDAGLPPPNAKPEDIAQGDLKGTLRVLYSIFGKYKSRFQQQQATPTSPTSRV